MFTSDYVQRKELDQQQIMFPNLPIKTGIVLLSFGLGQKLVQHGK